MKTYRSYEVLPTGQQVCEGVRTTSPVISKPEHTRMHSRHMLMSRPRVEHVQHERA